jgi:hypothetical protein
MRNKNEMLKNFIKGMSFGLFVVAVMFSTVGCDKKKSDSNANRNGWWGGQYGYGGGGYNGYGNVSNISAGIETSGRYMIILETATDPGTSGGFGYGQAYVQGEMQVNTPIGCGYTGAGLDPDIYQLVPYNGGAAQLNVDLLTNVVLIARGRYSEAIVTIPYARFFQTNVCGFEGMMGSLTIESINGYSCRLSTGFTDQGANQACGY